MRIVITYDNGDVFQHFGHSTYFKVYMVENDIILSSEVIECKESGHENKSKFLQDISTDVLICGQIGESAVSLLRDNGIIVCAGVKGNVDEAVLKFIRNELIYTEHPNCSHKHDSKDCNCDKSNDKSIHFVRK